VVALRRGRETGGTLAKECQRANSWGCLGDTRIRNETWERAKAGGEGTGRGERGSKGFEQIAKKRGFQASACCGGYRRREGGGKRGVLSEEESEKGD